MVSRSAKGILLLGPEMLALKLSTPVKPVNRTQDIASTRSTGNLPRRSAGEPGHRSARNPLQRVKRHVQILLADRQRRSEPHGGPVGVLGEHPGVHQLL